MAQETIDNGDDGLVVREKLNDMFTEIYNALFGIGSSGGTGGGMHWQIVYNPTLGVDELVPVEEIYVTAPTRFKAMILNINDQFIVNAYGGMFNYLLSNGIGTDHRQLEIAADGAFSAGIKGVLAYEDVAGNKTLTINDFAIYVTTIDAMLTMTLPLAATYIGKSFLIRKQSGNASVLIDAVGAEVISDGVLSAGSKGIAASGEWVLLRAKATGVWQVEASGGSSITGEGATARGVLEVSAHTNVSIDYAAYVGGSEVASIELTLPEIATVGVVDFTFRCSTSGSGVWAMTVLPSGTDIINFIGFTGSTGLTTVMEGAWVKVMSSTVDGNGIWYVIAGGENWEATV